MTLIQKIKQYTSSGVIPLHMPGHKRNVAMLGDEFPFDIDITEIPGFDDLHDMRGVLRETAEIAAALYGSYRAFPLVNSTTGGNLAAVRACVKYGDTVILPSNCHRSIYHACELCGLKQILLDPPVDETSGVPGSISPLQVETALIAHPETSAVIITSPSYEGVVCDVRAIAELAHARGIPLIVDSAHGAHLGFSTFFPESAVECGADLVSMSLHKTLPALTQCALLHVSGDIVSAEAVRHELDVFQTSSPSYVLLSSIDFCVRFVGEHKKRLFADYEKNLKDFYERIKAEKTLRATFLQRESSAFFARDPGKIVIFDKDKKRSGKMIAEALRLHGIETELANEDYVICMTSICDPTDTFERLADALISLVDEHLYEISGQI